MFLKKSVRFENRTLFLFPFSTFVLSLLRIHRFIPKPQIDFFDMYFKIIISWTFVLLFSFSLSSQTLDLAQKARTQFNSPNELRWLKHFKGQINDYNEVAIVLGFDGLLCKGVMKFLRSGEELMLDGVLENENLVLKEIDSEKNISGYIKGILKDNIFEGNWSNFDNTIGSPLEFEQAQAKNLLPSHCGKDKWMRRYTAISKNKVVELSLQKLQGESVNGMIYLKKENLTLKTRGEWSAKGLKLTLWDDYGNTVGELNAPDPSRQGFKGFLTYESKKITVLDFLLSARLKAGCVEFADYSSIYDIIYPRTTFASFNNWIEKLVTVESGKLNNRTSKAAAQITSFSPENRAGIRSGGWFEIGFFNENLLSGILVIQSTVAKQQRAIPVNFDLTNNRPIQFGDIFRAEYDLEYFVKNVIRKEFKKHRFYQTEPGFKNWIQTTSFPHMILLRNGIHFSSDFNAIYGRQGITIPYSRLTGFIKKDSGVDFSFRK